MKKPINILAFPSHGGIGEVHDGMTLRDYFANGAMMSLIQKCPLLDTQGVLGKRIDKKDVLNMKITLAHSAFTYADAMLAEREKENT